MRRRRGERERKERDSQLWVYLWNQQLSFLGPFREMIKNKKQTKRNLTHLEVGEDAKEGESKFDPITKNTWGLSSQTCPFSSSVLLFFRRRKQRVRFAVF
mmetsp:Transcript_27094/g.31259  ORF Transcript_27094/g.31259 Transcript_27094/m.31259 type:complete len:100 (+) Transcript_27094:129-428(+)